MSTQTKNPSDATKAHHDHVHDDACGCGHDHHGHHHHHHRPIAPFVRSSPKIGRNDPCPCGSGKKYKKCCLAA
nr:MAG: hypothetical protein DIU57_16685 [Pseudomonadota bacterium]